MVCSTAIVIVWPHFRSIAPSCSPSALCWSQLSREASAGYGFVRQLYAAADVLALVGLAQFSFVSERAVFGCRLPDLSSVDQMSWAGTSASPAYFSRSPTTPKQAVGLTA